MRYLGYSVIRKYGKKWIAELIDDGTLDTVIKVQDFRRKYPEEEMRFSDTSDLRKPDGSFTRRGWSLLAEQAVDEYSDAYRKHRNGGGITLEAARETLEHDGTGNVWDRYDADG
jgi:hypothetical protein